MPELGSISNAQSADCEIVLDEYYTSTKSILMHAISKFGIVSSENDQTDSIQQE